MTYINKICENDSCETLLIDPHPTRRFCHDCSKQRRKDKMKEYSKNRKPENQERNKEKRNEKRRKNRKENALKGLCECGEPVYETLRRCKLCHEKMIKSCTKHNRSKRNLTKRTIFL